MTHTPGPWKWDERATLISCAPSAEFPVLMAYLSKEPNSIAAELSVLPDNARLIAAAPDLLEALKYCTGAITEKDALIVAEAAIAKAEGKA